jgi:branched-chain amino acid transport system ATP-binding protein
VLKVDGVDVYYGDLQVLHDVSFEVREKEIVALLGSNGAGKSTTIKTISSLVTPKKGDIQFDGAFLSKMPPHKVIEFGVVHVPEGRHLFSKMTVKENLMMGALHGEAKVKRSETMAQVYSLFPRLKEREEQIAGTLSGGEQQMLAVSRGLMSMPKLMMFDEPSLGLAPLLVREVFNMVKQINHNSVAILLVEQNVNQTLSMCHRAYILENGRIVLEGTGRELLGNSLVRESYLGI